MRKSLWTLTARFAFTSVLTIVIVAGCKSKSDRPGVPMVAQGRVYDQRDSLPLAGASVLLVEPRLGAMTDSTGFYRVRNLPSAKYTIEVSHLGYVTHRENWILVGDGDTNRLDFYLDRLQYDNFGHPIDPGDTLGQQTGIQPQ